MTETTTKSVWDFLEEPNRHASKTQELYSWGLNYDFRNNPFWQFVDLIGWSDEQGLGRMTDPVTLGYVEAGYMAEALTEWADNPRGVEEWLEALLACNA